jgi:hypothetical protein
VSIAEQDIFLELVCHDHAMKFYDILEVPIASIFGED